MSQEGIPLVRLLGAVAVSVILWCAIIALCVLLWIDAEAAPVVIALLVGGLAVLAGRRR